MSKSLQGKAIAILLGPRGMAVHRFLEPRKAVAEVGAAVTKIGLEAGEAHSHITLSNK